MRMTPRSSPASKVPLKVFPAGGGGSRRTRRGAGGRRSPDEEGPGALRLRPGKSVTDDGQNQPRGMAFASTRYPGRSGVLVAQAADLGLLRPVLRALVSANLR